MPVQRKKMAAMKAEYGPKKGERVYYATETKALKKAGKKKGPSRGR